MFIGRRAQIVRASTPDGRAAADDLWFARVACGLRAAYDYDISNQSRTPSQLSAKRILKRMSGCGTNAKCFHVRFSNRPFRVKRFQTILDCGVNVARGLALLSGLGTSGPSIRGFEDEVEQSFGRPCRQCDGRFKRTYGLTSSIVPRGTSLHRWVDLRFPPI